MNEVYNLITSYKGKIYESVDNDLGYKIIITNNNTLEYKKHVEGSLKTLKREVTCWVGVQKKNDEYAIDYGEKSYEIKGGGGFRCKHDVLRRIEEKLTEYGFQKKQYEEQRLF